MLGILLAAGVVTLIDDEPVSAAEAPRPAEVRFVPLVKGGQTVALKVVRKTPVRRAAAW